MPEVVKRSADSFQLRSLNYVEIIPVIVNAIKEQNEIINQQKNLIELQKVELQYLKSKVDCISPCSSEISTKTTGNSNTEILYPRLEQNVPNPFGSNSTIKYYLPEGFQKGMILVSDLNGKQIKKYDVNPGNGQIEINGREFSAGTYLYTLISNDKEIDTKKMIIVGQ